MNDAVFGLIGVLLGGLLAAYCIRYDRFWEEFVGVEDGHTEYYDTQDYREWLKDREGKDG